MAANRHAPNTPLWLDLLLGAGFVGLAYGVDRVIGTYRAGPNRNASQHHDGVGLLNGDRHVREDFAAADGEGAIAMRPSQEPDHLQDARAADRGRGRRAANPAQIPVKGWKDILWRTYNQIGEDRLLAVAAGAVFYMLLALFPAVTALVSLYGLFTDPSVINEHLSLLGGVMPGGAIDIVREQVTRLTETGKNALGFGFLFGLLLALWSANAGIKAIIDALNVVYDEREKRSFIKLTLVAFAFTIGALVFVLLALAGIVILPLVLAWTGYETRAGEIVSLLRWPALLVIVMLWLAVLYRCAPSRERARWSWLSVGSIFAALAWLGGSALFSWYLSNFADYDATYGSLGAAIGLMMWLWLSVSVILVGGELNAEMEHQTAHDSTVGAGKPMGARGAVMADTVGEAAR
ncbi:MAG: YihY/virulence factor BrkB family protein [Methyloceanibacter sp.]|uniref:YihY/virulence factor BrkB family protein n=1 Tax=Methyloceanibacter sp. TaxID=1965321 RepID=UPI003D9B26C6